MQELPASGSYEQGLHGAIDDLPQLWRTRAYGVRVSFRKVYGAFSQEVLNL